MAGLATALSNAISPVYNLASKGALGAAKNLADQVAKSNWWENSNNNNNSFVGSIGQAVASAANQVANNAAQDAARKAAEQIAIQNSAYNPARDKGFSNMGNTVNGVSQATLANLFADASKDIGGVLGAMEDLTSDAITKGFKENQKENNKNRLSDAWNSFTNALNNPGNYKRSMHDAMGGFSLPTSGEGLIDPWSLPAQAYAEDYANAGIDRRREINPIAQTMWEWSPTEGGLSSIQNSLDNTQLAPEAIGYQNLQDFRNQAKGEELEKANAAYNDMAWSVADLLTAPIGFGTSKAVKPVVKDVGGELAKRGGIKNVLKGTDNLAGEYIPQYLPQNLFEGDTLPPLGRLLSKSEKNVARDAELLKELNNISVPRYRGLTPKSNSVKTTGKNISSSIEKNSIPFDEPALKGLETNIGETTNSLFTNAAKNVGKNEIARDISSSQVFKNALAELGAAGMASVPLLELAGLASSTGKEGAIANGSWDNKQVGTWVGSDGRTYMGNPETHEIEYEFPNNSNMASWTGKYIMPDGSIVDEFVPGSVPDTPYNRKAKEMQRSLDTQRYFEKFMDTGEDPYLRGDSHDAQRFGYNVAPVYNKIVEADNANINDQTGWEFIDPYLTYEYKSNHGFKDYQDVRNALNRRMNTYDYLDDLTPEKRRALRKEGMFETFGGEERNPKNREELYGNIAESLNRDMYDDNGNYLIDTRTAPENLDQADRFYYYANMGTGDYGEHKGAENWLDDLGKLMGADYAAAIPSRENAGFTNFRVLSAEPTFNNQNIVGSYGDTVDRLWTDLFEQELRDSNNEEDKKMLDENGHLKRDKDGKLSTDVRSFINDYFSREGNYLDIDDDFNITNYKQIGTDYNAIKDFVNFMEQNAPNHDWVPVTMDENMAEMIFGSKDPNASLAQYITNALAMQELQSGLGGPIDTNGYIDLRDINSALRDVGDNIVIGNKKDNPMFSNTSVSNKKLRGNSMYPLGDLENGINYEGWVVPEGFSVDNRGQDNAGLYKADARDVDRLLQSMGSNYGYTRANSQDYQNYLDNLYGGFSVAPLGNTVATPRGEFVGNNNINNNEGEAIYSPEHPVMKNYINQAINNPYQYSIDPFYFTQGAYL